MTAKPELPAEARLRIDKWLWAARFFKTRALATTAVEGGKVHLNGERTKAAKGVKLGDRIEVVRGEETFEIVVRSLSGQRGPASVAQTLYEETPASRSRREAAAETRRLHFTASPRPDVRPDKKARRTIIRFIRGKD